MAIRMTKHVLQTKIIDPIDIQDWNAPMSEKNPEMNFKDGYSKIVCLILYLYSMELGYPPLYAEVNRVSRELDFTYLKELGPYAMALYFVTMWGNFEREGNESIVKTGKSIGGVEENLTGSYLLWRGARMRREWIRDFLDKRNGSVKFKGFTSCSRSLRVALGFAFNDDDPDYMPVVFSIACSNYAGPLGVVMNSEAYTAYPQEGEVLFMEGATVNVWGIEYGVKIVN